VIKVQKVSNNGFHGIFYANSAKDKAIIIISGSDGGIKWAHNGHLQKWGI
jgi:hypothetical protein